MVIAVVVIIISARPRLRLTIPDMVLGGLFRSYGPAEHCTVRRSPSYIGAAFGLKSVSASGNVALAGTVAIGEAETTRVTVASLAIVGGIARVIASRPRSHIRAKWKRAERRGRYASSS